MHIPSEPSKKGRRCIISSNPKVNANCFNLKSYLGCSSLHFGHRVRTLGARAAILSKGFELWPLQLPFRAKGSYFWCSSCHFEQRVRTFGAPGGRGGNGDTPLHVRDLCTISTKNMCFYVFLADRLARGSAGRG